ncbi:uncharacterized protein JN550_009027 [Neoarthrinium moseri]|uniref:uncharacterized protein n=1 Tax=Neoarthrinium moseri TaxID=1658444 RepID=UPI001FDB9901|nr:uncharacterized protein JN550_009027 [Neoarthrinium moseri]KAI1864007.1 hypothetical protein JN550_009027 [Neoarthrinium moseri]
MEKPIVLQMGDDIRWNLQQYDDFKLKFEIRRSFSMPRPEFIQALKNKTFGEFFAIYRPYWNTGGEVGNWDDELISLLPDSCKIIASAGAGFDWVDTECLARKGVTYCNSAAACTESVADAGLWLIISTFRLFSWSALAARSGVPEQFSDVHNNLAAVTRNPNGFTLGIIGYGRIGRRIAEKAHAALNMKILYHDIVEIPSPVPAAYHKNMDTLLAEADCVLLAAPYSQKTLIDEATLSKMKKGARLVNIARGRLIDENALVSALKSGQIYSAGLDVHFDEPNVNKELINMRNVELLSHNAGASLDSHIGFARLGMENIVSFSETGKAVSPVNAHLIEQSRL